MKRVIPAASILVFVCILSVVTLLFQLKTIDNLEITIKKVQDSYTSGKEEECMKLTKELVEQYQSSTRFFPFFMRHSDSAKIEESIVTLPALLKSESKEHFEAELTKCRNMIEKLAELETPSMDNIL